MTEANQCEPWTIEMIRTLPSEQRLCYVERIRVVYPQWTSILAEVRARHVMQAVAAEPPCLLLIGRTGTGKSTLMASYASQYPATITPEEAHKPIVQATIIPPATVKGLAMTLLHALGDPAANSGTTAGMTNRLVQLFRACGVELLILDELQHFVDRDSAKVLINVSNWLKTVIKEAQVACVLVGLEGEAEQVVDSNPQLARLFGDPIVLRPFTWDVAQPTSINAFRALLDAIERQLPLREPSHLAREATAQRIFVASDGVVGYVMALLRRATGLALAHQREQLDQTLLALAFEQRLGGLRRGIANPFRGDLPAVPPPGSGAPAGVSPATNRRGIARRRQRELLGDGV